MIVTIIILTAIAIGVVILLFIRKKKLSNDEVINSETETPIIDNPGSDDSKPSTSEEKPEENTESNDKPSVPQNEPSYNQDFENYLSKFDSFAKVERDSTTYNWFYELYKEAKSQIIGYTAHNLPRLLHKDNFPTLHSFGEAGNINDGENTLIGWLFALQLAELKPYNKADIFKIGYELGGYNKYCNIYGYKFEYDPNILRIVAAAIYSTMRGLYKPNVDTIREEVGGTKYNKSLKELYDESKDNLSPESFFTDFRVFMATAPGPYTPGYTKRPDYTYPNEIRDEYNNLKIDRDVHEMIVNTYNLNNTEHFQEVVQAIADKEVNTAHLFGKNKETKHYHFHPVFGEDTIGIELKDNDSFAEYAYLVFKTGSSSRIIMQSATVNPVQYGRLRPGCSWNQEAKKNSATNDRRNILTNFEIEDGDGSPTGYYDQNGNWVYMNNIHNPAEFEEYQKNTLYANSYPSGHSAGSFCTSMLLMELMPDKADKILKAANQYALNRTICRYHWTSDTLNGRILGSATNAICHATNDYDKILNTAKINLNS